MIISIDIGGTYIRISSLENKIIKFKTDTFDKSFINICNAIDNLSKNICLQKIGISSVGPLDLKQGTILEPPNLDKSWQYICLKKHLQTKYPNTIIEIENDANVAALGQYLIQKEKPKSLVYITFSTGIGGGLILNGKIYHGFSDTAFEIANSIPDYSYNKNGHKSGVEYFAGGNGLIKQAYQYGLVIKETKELFDLYYQNDIIATKILNEAENKIASMLSTTIYMINPEMIVIGGSIALNNQEWFQKIIDKVLTTTQDIRYKTKIVFAKDLDEATLLACTKL